MTYKEIYQSVKKIKRKYGENDPFRLCRLLGYALSLQNLGTHEGCIKGYFVEILKVKTIVVNVDLPEVIQRIIVAHEICHALHHRTREMQTFHEIAMFDNNIQMERDANLFAAEYLLEDQEVFEALNLDTTFTGAAAVLRVPAELLDFKFRVMKWKGYKLIEPPISARSNFMKDMVVPENADYYS